MKKYYPESSFLAGALTLALITSCIQEKGVKSDSRIDSIYGRNALLKEPRSFQRTAHPGEAPHLNSPKREDSKDEWEHVRHLIVSALQN